MPCNELAERRALAALRGRRLEESLTILMQAYGHEIFRFCVSQLGNPEDAQDVLQTVFIQAHAGFASFDGRSSFRTWLFSIARHRSLDRAKSERRLQSHLHFVDQLPELEADDGQPAHENLALERVLARCLGQLTRKIREVVVLRLQLEHSYEEIARLLNETPGTLQARVARALPILKRCVEQQGVSL